MTDGNITFAGGYTLLAMYIQLIDGSKTSMNIAPLVPSFTITESLSNESIRGSASVIDYTGTLEDYPIRGEERLILEVEDSMGNKRVYDLFLYKVSDVKPTDTNDGLTYVIHFTSYQRFMSERSKIIAPFKLPISDIVDTVFNEYFTTKRLSNPSDLNRQPNEMVADQTNKEIDIEDTEGVLECVIPNLTPTQAMKFLESRAYSVSSPSCSFRFFESANKFHFVSDEKLFLDAFKNKKVFNFTFSEGIGNTPDKFAAHMNNLTDLSNPNRVDTIADIHGGTYRSRVMVLDIINRSVNLRDEGYKYLDSRDTYFNTLDGQKIVDRHDDEFIDAVFNTENARQFIIVKDYEDVSNGQLRGDQHYSDIVSNRLAYRNHLNGTSIEATGHGRIDITCGDVIYLNIPEFTHSSNKKSNKQLSGHYLVQSVTKDFDMEVAKNYYRLVKRDWAEKEDSRVNSFLKTGLGGL